MDPYYPYYPVPGFPPYFYGGSLENESVIGDQGSHNSTSTVSFGHVFAISKLIYSSPAEIKYCVFDRVDK